MTHSAASHPVTDEVFLRIAEYVCGPAEFGIEAYDTARLCLIDSIGCGLLALNYPACTKLLGPIVPGATLTGGARVPGIPGALDPVKAAFDIGTAIRWLDFNDTWLAAEWGHPSDNFGAILGVADYLARNRPAAVPDDSAVARALTVRDVLAWAIKAYEVQGVLALENSFNRVGIDHVLLVKVASAAVATRMLGGTRDQVCDAVSNAFIEASLRTYRHAPNTGSRKSWAAGDATSRGVRLALMAIAGEMGYPSALTTNRWGVQDVWLKGESVKLSRPFGSYVTENILFKISFPAEFHAQTAVEAAITLHPQVSARLEQVERIVITTQEPAVRIIDKTGPLHNPADRDHCIQYMAAVGLIFGDLMADHYEDKVAADPRIDALRAKMQVREDPRYTADYYDPEKRSIANAVQVWFTDGGSTENVAVEYPVGHRRRRSEAIPLLYEKFRENVSTRFTGRKARGIVAACMDSKRLDGMPVDEFMNMLALPKSRAR